MRDSNGIPVETKESERHKMVSQEKQFGADNKLMIDDDEYV